MSYLRKANNAKTTLNGGINSSVTELVVTDATDFSDSGDFLITLWDSDTYNDPTDDSNREICKVTGVSGNTFTIERAQEDTTAHSHSNGAMVAMLITAGHFTEIEDAITANAGSAFDVDINGDLEPSLTVNTDEYYEYDSNEDLMPIA